MNIGDVRFIVASSYEVNNVIFEYVNKNLSFKLHDISFVFNGTDYDLYVNNMLIKDMDMLYENYYGFFDNRYYVRQYYDINEIIKNNQLDNLIKFITLVRGSIYVYDKAMKAYVNKSSTSREYITNIITAKLPFRYKYTSNALTNVLYLNNINGEYNLYDPFDVVTDEDIANINHSEIMNSI